MSAQRGDGTFGLEYKGSLIYRRNSAGKLTLESTPFGGGRIIASETSSGMSYAPHYFITDHLRSTRAIVDANGNVKERNDYYPFGPKFPKPGFSQSDNRFGFSGKEDQEQLGLGFQDFGVRMYEPTIGRWWSMDPLSEKYYSISLCNK